MRLSHVVSIVILLAAGPAAAQVQLLPNLQPLPPRDISMVRTFPGGVQLRFSTISWNNGMGPMEIWGGDISADGLTQEVWQRVYSSDGTYTQYLAGNFVYHPEHGHIHLEDYAVYTLEPVDPSSTVVGVSSKTSFCLLDSVKVNGRLDGAPRKAYYTTCNAVRQGISVGWGDEYYSTLPGQSIDVTDFPAGTYKLTLEVDPYNELHEIDDTDNVAAVLLQIDPAAATVTVIGQVDPGANVRVDSITPALMFRGDTVQVTITGEGFDAGLPVSLQGDGGAPTVSNVIYESGTTIKATLTAKAGGPARARVFDVYVGPAVLVDGFTVMP